MPEASYYRRSCDLQTFANEFEPIIAEEHFAIHDGDQCSEKHRALLPAGGQAGLSMWRQRTLSTAPVPVASGEGSVIPPSGTSPSRCHNRPRIHRARRVAESSANPSNP